MQETIVFSVYCCAPWVYVCVCDTCVRHTHAWHTSGERHSFCSRLMASLAGLLRWKPRCHGNAARLCELEAFRSLSQPSLTLSPSLSLSLSVFMSLPRPLRPLSASPLHLSPPESDRTAADAWREVCMYTKERGDRLTREMQDVRDRER